MKKRILVIISRLHIGGAEKVARDLALYANREKYQFDYLLFSDRVGEYEAQLEAAGCGMIRIDEPSCGYGKHIRVLRRIMRENHYDIVHAHTMFNCGWSMWVAKRCDVPVRIAHSHSALVNGGGMMKTVYEKLMRSLILTCSTDLVGCGEKAGRRLFGEKAWDKRGQLILNGIDVASFAYNAQKRNTIRNQLDLGDQFVMGHAGHLVEVKNQSFLLDLMPEVLKRRPDAMLLLLGEGSDRPVLEQKIRDMGLENHVIMTGNVSNVADYLSAMDVFVFPSLFEGTPLSILEVQANGLPCVISDSVPPDVFLTDLIHPLSLQAPKDTWVDMILNQRRTDTQHYNQQLRGSDYAVETAMEKIYRIYNKRN